MDFNVSSFLVIASKPLKHIYDSHCSSITRTTSEFFYAGPEDEVLRVPCYVKTLKLRSKLQSCHTAYMVLNSTSNYFP